MRLSLLVPLAAEPGAQTEATFDAGAHPASINESENDRKEKFISSLNGIYHSPCL